jgi:hypothetical protein
MMNRTVRFASSLFLAAAIAAPVSIVAAPAPQDASVQIRVYDANHKDYHNWDDRENGSYRRWHEERHDAYVDYDRLKKRDQRAYWNWRHEHQEHEEHEHMDHQ